MKDAFFGRDLLDKCKDSQVDELDLESDNDRDFPGGTNATVDTAASTTCGSVLGSSKHVSAKAANAMEIADLTETPVDTAPREHQPPLAWSETKPDLSSNLANLCPDVVPGDDSDKDHNFGNGSIIIISFVQCSKWDGMK